MKNNLENDPIDFIVTWVDGNDPVWATEREIYAKKEHLDSYSTGGKRFRDWDLFKYWFRAVEKFAPWVHKVYLVTYGHVPKWLNTKNPKLVIVKHSDFMPKEYLPTYNSVALELNFHRIKGLCNRWVYFNDDLFIGRPVMPEDYFKGDKIKYNLLEVSLTKYGPESHTYRNMLVNTTEVINRNFKKTRFKNLTYKDIYALVKNLQAFTFEKYIGFGPHHHWHAYKRETYEELWRAEPEICDITSRSKFRNGNMLSSEVLDLWQVGKGRTVHFRQRARERYHALGVFDTNKIKEDILSGKYISLRLNDECPDNKFEETKAIMISAFEEYLPDKSSFEK